jgi:N,N'-diacetylbacillosaminyl-diphospho-undecaprenol alpha-1,3-N-acetylgalactosaminyltransferase
MKNFRLFAAILRAVRNIRPDVVHNFTHKPAVLGTLAARLAGVRRIFVTITGLGVLFSNNDWGSKIKRTLLLIQYRLALRFATAVFFQNPDDLNYFVARRLVNRKRAVLTAGSGIDVEAIKPPTDAEIERLRSRLEAELGVALRGKRVVLLAARGIPEKGLFVFYGVARSIAAKRSDYVFVHLGIIDQGTALGGKYTISQYAKLHGVHYLGFKDSILDYMAAADIVCLPSFYREGVPRSLIEALALGKFIVTTDTPGCRDTVQHGMNGYLCRPRDPASLEVQLLRITEGQLTDARRSSRALCESKFDARLIVQETLGRYFEDA